MGADKSKHSTTNNYNILIVFLQGFCFCKRQRQRCKLEKTQSLLVLLQLGPGARWQEAAGLL